MSADLVTAVYRHSLATGRARAVLLAMAHLASHERFTRYGEALAYPIYSTLAEMGRCSPKTVERAVQELVELGEIRWTGETKGQGARVYEIVLADDGTPDTVVGAIDASGDTFVGGSSQNLESADTVVGGSSPKGEADAPTSDSSDRTPDISGPTPDTVVGGPPTPVSDDRGRMEKLERDTERARAPARGRSSHSPDDDWTEYARRKLGPRTEGETLKDRNHRRAEEAEDADERRETMRG